MERETTPAKVEAAAAADVGRTPVPGC